MDRSGSAVPKNLSASGGRITAYLRGRYDKGFTLLVTILLTSLLTVLGVAMLTLSSITLKSASDNAPKRVAQANARLAMALALGELQSELGDDRRITADSDIISSDPDRPNMVGVWDSVAPTNLLDNPQSTAPDYAGWKTQKFRKWLVSSGDIEQTRRREYAMSAPGRHTRKIFNKTADGFDLSADLVRIKDDQEIHGAMAWAVSQEATRARLDLGSDPGSRPALNDSIQAPSGPYVGLSGVLSQPVSGWAEREGKVLDVHQAALDPGYSMPSGSQGVAGADFTATAQGILTDVVKGGLKTDLSLGFDLSDGQFRRPRLNEVKNPFAANSSAVGETPLYAPLNGGAPISINVSYPPIMYQHKMETGSPPTFQTLRSYYSLYKHLYTSGGQKTAFAREQTSAYWGTPDAPSRSQTSVSPVLDRVMFFLGLSVGDDNIAHLVVTPVVTLWNPYNVAIDTEGYVIYPWMDFPINIQWTVRDSQGATVATAHSWLSTFLGSGDTGEGRSTQPYFFCQLTANGDGTTTTPIHLNPGEVRVFTPLQAQPLPFKRTGDESDRTIRMRPVQKMEDFHVEGGLTIPMNASMWQDGDNLNYELKDTDRIEAIFQFTRDQHNYFVTMEDSTRIHFPKGTGRVLSEVQVMAGKLSAQTFGTPSYPRNQLKMASQPVGVLETYHRSAGQTGQLSDIVFTANPRQRYVNNMVSASNFAAGPQYEASMRQIATVIGSGLQVTPDGRRSYFGYNNSADQGRDYLSFFHLPDEPLMSLGGFQNADLSDSAFGPASQFGNSWAPAYLPRNYAGRLVPRTPGNSPLPVIQPYGERIEPKGLGIYDHSWLLNTALWDGFFFSSIAPQVQLQERAGSPEVYGSNQSSLDKSTAEVVSSWLQGETPLRNPRMKLYRSGASTEDLQHEILSPAGCRKIAAHLFVDGAFNVNSTREGAWVAMLASLRGQAIQLQNSSHRLADIGQNTPFPRLLSPTGDAGDAWDGFRTLTDKQIKVLAKEIVAEIRTRGPAQSLGEFVNRRLSNDAMGLKGTLQAAIDRSGINDSAKLQRFDTSKFPYPANVPEPYTGIGTPGWLTQADLLNSLGPIMTVRSDTFTIRTYGEARDDSGHLLASAWYEAVVQRLPEWLETADSPASAPEDVSPASARFGRRFEIRSFRELSRADLDD